jgi:hypothetical protein
VEAQLSTVSIPCCGRGCLYGAAWNGRQGRWRISWDALDQAAWKDVANCEIDGVPMTGSTPVKAAITKP